MTAPAATNVVDPVCGMTITPENAAAHVAYRGATYYFCSKTCLERFNADPERYVLAASGSTAKSASTPVTRSVEYTCPMHPEVRQDRPGSCPKCGMALEPITPVVSTTRPEWTCPMHPQIVRDKPGNCPICGMALEPRVVSAEETEANPELRDMTRRFWVATAFTLPLVLITMGDILELHH